MVKLKEKFKNLWNIFKGVFNNFPVTLIIILITTIICAICVDNTDIMSEKTLSIIIQFAFIFLCGTFLIETIVKNKDKKLIIWHSIAAVIAFILTYCNNFEIKMFAGNEQFLNIILRIIASYCITTILLAIYFNYKKSKMNFEEYVTHVATNIFKSGIIYGLLSAGIATITAIFIFLILGNDDYSLIFRIEILILGLYYIPQLLHALYDTKDEIGKFIKVLVKYVLDILLIIAFAIIYIYFAKVLILRDIPSNQIFRIIAALFIIGCPIWTMASYFNDEKILDKINQKLPILFLPFLLLQGYSIGVRIISNGITEIRYLGVVLMLLEIIYVIMYIKNKKKIGNILIVIAILTLVSTIIPYINMFNISKISQYNNLKIYKEKTEYTDDEKEKIKGAYYYLLDNTEKGEEIIHELLDDDDIEKIENFKIENTTIERRYIYGSMDDSAINVEGYKTLYECTIADNGYDSKGKDGSASLKNVKFNVLGTDEIIQLDLTNLFEEYIKHEEDIDEYLKENNEIVINDNSKFMIRYISINFENVSKNIEYYSIEGCLLQK